MATDKALLKEVTKELWGTVKKLRPEVDKDTRLQLVLKALITIGDLPDQIQAAMVVGVCGEMEGDLIAENEKNTPTINQSSKTEEATDGRRVVRRSSANR